MALSKEARLSLLNRAVQLESRSFLEYMTQTAPPVDVDRNPDAARVLAEIAHEEDVVVDDLVEAIEAEGGHPEALKSYDLTFTSYNYVTTKYALEVIKKHLLK